jgi:hypothetical protein
VEHGAAGVLAEGRADVREEVVEADDFEEGGGGGQEDEDQEDEHPEEVGQQHR